MTKQMNPSLKCSVEAADVIAESFPIAGKSRGTPWVRRPGKERRGREEREMEKERKRERERWIRESVIDSRREEETKRPQRQRPEAREMETNRKIQRNWSG